MLSALGLAPVATAKAGRASIDFIQRDELRQVRPLDREFEAALDDRRERDVGERQPVEREIRLARDMAVENLELRDRDRRICAAKSARALPARFLASLNTAT